MAALVGAAGFDAVVGRPKPRRARSAVGSRRCVGARSVAVRLRVGVAGAAVGFGGTSRSTAAPTNVVVWEIVPP